MREEPLAIAISIKRRCPRKPRGRKIARDDGGTGERRVAVCAYTPVVMASRSQAPGLRERRALNLLRRQSRGVKR